MANEYTTSTEMEALAGELGIDLRSDDADQSDLSDRAVLYAGGRIDFYCQDRYLASDLALSQYVRDAATAFGLQWWAMRRMNSVPESLASMIDQYIKELTLVLEKRAGIPRTPTSRRAVVTSNQNVDLRRANNQVRVDRSRSTGVAKGYNRVVDQTAPDQR
jgi:hypothetical protein